MYACDLLFRLFWFANKRNNECFHAITCKLMRSTSFNHKDISQLALSCTLFYEIPNLVYLNQLYDELDEVRFLRFGWFPNRISFSLILLHWFQTNRCGILRLRSRRASLNSSNGFPISGGKYMLELDFPNTKRELVLVQLIKWFQIRMFLRTKLHVYFGHLFNKWFLLCSTHGQPWFALHRSFLSGKNVSTKFTCFYSTRG